ncbi:hypothetical protein ATANTOWER_032609 [Ataeniobius toweri]|uniref:C2H2-type domain-containing protein n=1 Tax=Ataeniobius toweri TaxID=208326 RepID=A0ABU7BKL3_9TELE|nr:hypothetical protein [Ataeniobius toweri]
MFSRDELSMPTSSSNENRSRSTYKDTVGSRSGTGLQFRCGGMTHGPESEPGGGFAGGLRGGDLGLFIQAAAARRCRWRCMVKICGGTGRCHKKAHTLLTHGEKK